MTEAEWLACTDPTPMLEFLRGKASERKLRLFACACCRRGWFLLTRKCQRALEIAERYADSEASVQKLLLARFSAIVASRVYQRRERTAESTLMSAVASACQQGTSSIPEAARNAAEGESFPYDPFRAAGARREQAVLLRCILSNHIYAPSLNQTWLAWNDAATVKLAQVIYAQRCFDRLPILGDSLEDAGCTDSAILDHCRNAGPHVRGCWVIDLLLGKE